MSVVCVVFHVPIQTWKGLQVCKKALRVEQMNPSAFVEQAAEYDRILVNGECRGPGDLDNAMRRVEQKWGVPHSVSWALRYRKPKTIAADVFARLQYAVDAYREQQITRLENERASTKATTRLGSYLVRAADFVAGAED